MKTTNLDWSTPAMGSRSVLDRELSQFEHQLLDHLSVLSDFHGKVFLAHAQESLEKLAAQRGTV